MAKSKGIKLYLFLCVGVLLPFFSFAQFNGNNEMGSSGNAPANETFYKYAIQGGVQVDFPVSNNAMVKTFGGIYALNLSYDFSILKRLFIGAEVHLDQFAVSPNPLYQSINPKMFNYMGGIRIGYHSAFSKDNDFLFCATFTAGIDKIMYADVPDSAPKQPHGYNQQTIMGIFNVTEYYRVNDQFWVGLGVSFTYLPYQFSPNYLGLQNEGYTFVPSDSQGATMYIGFGFQAYYCFSKK